ncbi:LLM class flavin-dependent oxidoreductase [Streptomyces zagrosensis]|uniref:Alkanesulfonate monooxygenase SsuD/methylene tetrahydromethanopterin reductase-like flavin-dependent oxidoreductase (Luciferase family) n=1 Tax=Streptomyces zagrosensis TaxID=1042984 RepID=A0A7W9UZZ5_9ACTN|nr:LLM class flavin-dependent oxidoreductase [Streptomyces zagrosensis]MBB5936269.1 alkanesulfonate monooxygenase SsuD/methylene tetrahydromethanopterin reductase-like flavin-dependent oxidoreductase (luciferase family) [Streptomyces zagrosensis]
MTRTLARLEIGVVLPSLTVQHEQRLDFASAAQHAEGVGLDLVAYGDQGDQLVGAGPSVEMAVALAAVAAVTQRVRICSAGYVPGIRPLAWAARQIASLRHVVGDRLVLGIGTGGGAAQWAAAGVPYAERDVRTDTALALLPRLLAGERVRLPDEPGGLDLELTPTVPQPPVWVGGDSPAAIRRAIRYGDGWFPSLVTPDEVANGVVQLAERAVWRGRPAPTVAVGATGVLGAAPGLPGRAEIAARMAVAYGMPVERLASVPVTGGPREAAEQLHPYWGAGARHIVMGFADGDWRAQVDALAEVRELLA